MGVLLKAWGLGFAIFVTHEAGNATLAADTTHTLTQQCAWVQRPWARLLALDVVNVDARSREHLIACRMRRGLKSRSPIVNVIVERWPSEEEIASYDQGALHAR